MTKSQLNLTFRLAALLVVSVAVLCLYRWYYANGDPDAHPIYSESRGIPPAAAPSLKTSVESTRTELTQIIKSQLTAFHDDDYVTAYAFAADGVKSEYSLAAFERMVKLGYPLIARFKAATFGAMRDNGEAAMVSVEIEGESGRTLQYLYFLRKEGSGWKINGVVEEKPKDTVV